MVAKILVMGLPGSGKTTLAHAMRRRMLSAGARAVIVDGDEIRKLYRDIDFSEEGRINQAHRIGELADILNNDDTTAICSFVCPTPSTRTAFWGSTPKNDQVWGMTVFVNRIAKSTYPDTDRIFVPPVIDPYTDFMVTPYNMSAEDAAAGVLRQIRLVRLLKPRG